jgi:hypothetical protein
MISYKFRLPQYHDILAFLNRHITIRPGLKVTLLLLGISFFCNIQSFAQSQATFDFGGYMQNWVTLNKNSEQLDDSGQVTNANTQDFRIRRARFYAKGSTGSVLSGATWVDISGDNPALLDLYLNAKLNSWLNIQAGQFVNPAQSYNTGKLYSSRLMLYERPTVTTRLASAMGLSAFRDVGIMAHGESQNVWYGLYLGSGKGRLGQFDGPLLKSGNGLAGARVDVSLTDRITVGGHLAVNRQQNLTNEAGNSMDKLRRSASFRLSLTDIALDGLSLDAEYLYLRTDDRIAGLDEEWSMKGFYMEAGYEITEPWVITARFDEKIDYPMQSGFIISDRYTLGLTRIIKMDGSEFARIHLDYSYAETGQAHLDESVLMLVVQLKF